MSTYWWDRMCCRKAPVLPSYREDKENKGKVRFEEKRPLTAVVVQAVNGAPASSAGASGRGRGRQPLAASRVQIGTSPSMDQIGYRAEAPTKVEGPKKNFDGTFFVSTKSPRRAFYTIHPEWISENLSCQKLTLKERTSTFPPRRCKSAPPTTRAASSSRTRNPITWENWNVKPHR